MICPHCGASIHEVDAKRVPNVGRIVRVAAEYLGISPLRVIGQQQKRELAYARFIVSRIAADYGHPYSRIGRGIGNRDHTTAMYGARRASELAATVPSFRLDLGAIAAIVAGEVYQRPGATIGESGEADARQA